ncbi:MAG2-interacting protein [Actinidia chinensis var. chinensis]|uniref:MAG2-interacting protein n=1 Tax=Actinidia chinensis var. chinensis TaxID=1590841 RepID=A0A2R6RSI0_ACTCC|nr:MAG2-interacting protein [Actinidia chinensis var. chinensis]
MEAGVREVFYETRSHASKPYSPNYPPQHQQLNEGFKGSLLSLLSSRGVNELKEKWSGYRSPRKLRRWTSLFVSPRGEYVAVALGNQLTILQKDDDYQQACGFFTNGSLGTFTFGIWSEFHDVLGVADDAGMLYFIKANGEEITRITKRILKVSSPIVGLIAPDGSDNKTCLCSFNVLTSDGSLHEVEISQDPSASIFSARASNNGSTLKEFPENVFCLNYHPETSLLAVVGGAVSVPMTSSGSIDGSLGTFTFGIWSEFHDVLGVADDAGMLYFIKANGEEITRITKRILKVSSPIVGLIAPDGSDNKTCLCSFNVLTSDGSLHEVEISQDPSASIFSARASNNGSTLKEFPENVFCLNYHPETSLLAVVGGAVSVPMTSSGSYTLSIWRRTMNLDLELVFSTQFEGLYSKPKGYVGRLTSPKVLFSPEGKFVATLDLRGHLVIFKLDNELCSLSNVSCGEKYDSQVASDMSTREKESLNDITDFTWWSDHIIALAKRSGVVTMIDIFSRIKLLEKDPLYSMPVLESVQQFPGCLFILESTSEYHDSSSENAASHLQHTDLVTEDKYNHLDIAKLRWSLLSFSKKSVSEMYGVLITDQKYQVALDFANRHGLDKDEVFRTQWLHSARGINEINMFLSVMKDQVFILAECVESVGPTEEAVRALIAQGLHLTDQYKFSETEINENSQIWDFRLTRLKLLQFRDKLETFLGINMGRFSVQEYNKFRHMPINEAAVTLAESGKIGALNLLFKRHPYSLTPFMLEILAAIPETVPVQSYGQLLPGNSPPSNISLREKDWVECRDMVTFVSRLPENHESCILLKTEHITKQCLGFSWPSTAELSIWYKSRARDMDSLSGQLDNCLSLVDFACRKGIYELQQFHEDISYLHQLIYSDGNGYEVNFTMSLVAWEQLSDFGKFKMMLKEVREASVVERLRKKAIPFMQNRFHIMTSISEDAVLDEHSTADWKADSFLVRWLKEMASENKLDICLKVIEEGCKDFQSNSIFRDNAETVDCSLQCIYMCNNTERWSTMASILSKLPEMRDSESCVEDLKKRLKVAEGHIEAGRLLSFYQVPKPINFFLEAHSDGKGVKQIIRLILSKFVRRQPGHSDNDWANMWRDLQSLKEKAFPFLDQEYMLMEFCRGLLKAGKFSLARNYLRGTASVALATDKAENLVIQAAREYFFSASSLTCSEVWKARECLNLFPGSRNVRAEADIVDALTVKLPNLGVNILPVQFRQIKDPMEIIKLAITSQVGAYLSVDELIEIAKLLGLSSHEDISAVQEAIAREAAVAGDLQLAFDLCLVLAKKGHGSIWDLCAAMARGPELENMDISSRKQLLGFALSYCDDESIGELLAAWKDLDMQSQCEKLMTLTGTDPPKFSVHGSSIISLPLQNSQDMVDLRDYSEQVDGINCDDQEVHIKDIKKILSLVAKDLSKENGCNWETAH